MVYCLSLMYCDLHIHSSASDGTDPPQTLPRLAKEAGLCAFALTDHDTTAGLSTCADAAKKIKIEFIAGIELSANPQLDRDDPPRGTLHILGYGIQHNHPRLLQIEQWLHEARAQRNPHIIENLNRLGVKIDYDEVVETAACQVVGRPHIAQVMVKKGYVKSIHEAFARYIGEGQAAYARKDRLSARDAIDAIHQAAGAAVLAHPVQLYRNDSRSVEHIAKRLQHLGLDGIETRHSDHTPQDVQRFEKLAARLNLLPTGGSDYHGSRKSVELGTCQVPYGVCEALVAALSCER